MTSLKQIEANRRNALKSTGPTTEEGKEHSRCNAVRHGLTAETIIADLEDANDYQAFEAAVITANCIRPATSPPGGRSSTSSRSRLPRDYGSRRIPSRR